jgi:hypothetical protein
LRPSIVAWKRGAFFRQRHVPRCEMSQANVS